MNSKVKISIISIALFFLSFEGLLQTIAFFREKPNFSHKSKNELELRILVVGESTSYGLFLKNKQDSFPEVLSRLIAEVIQRPTFVYNYSIPGAYSEKIAGNMANHLRDASPHLIVCNFGNNDFNPILNPNINSMGKSELPSFMTFFKTTKFIALWWQEYFYKRKALDYYAEHARVYFKAENAIGKPWLTKAYKQASEQLYLNYGKVINLARENNIPIIMVSYFHTFEDARKTLNKVSQSYNVPLVDLHHPNIERSLLEYDLWHPSAKGHHYIAQEIFKNLKAQGFLKLKEGQK